MAQLGNSGLASSACAYLGSLKKVVSAEVFWFCFPPYILSGPIWSQSKNHFFLHTEGKNSPRSLWFWFDYPRTILHTIISLVLGGERWVVHFEGSSFKNPFFFPQNVTVEGECVTARLENASQTVLKVLLAQTAQPSVRLSWEYQKLILLLYLDAYKS